MFSSQQQEFQNSTPDSGISSLGICSIFLTLKIQQKICTVDALILRIKAYCKVNNKCENNFSNINFFIPGES